jgi:2-amino-4-hydroxy-6-hydroxymethyldihydropteridine diphosphokinase
VSQLHPIRRRVAIGLGSSLGRRRAQLELALRMLNAKPGLQLIRASRWYLTPPLTGGTARCPFINGVGLFESALEPMAILRYCRQLEEAAGRRRARYWGDRTLDLDILLADDLIINEPTLTLPHPAIAKRPFVLNPLLEVWPDAINPHTQEPWSAAPVPFGPTPIAIGVAPRPATLYEGVRPPLPGPQQGTP